jgi:hypothetical protein
MTNRRARLSTTLCISALMLVASCHHEPPRFEGLDPRQMPDEVRPDYALFANRCSKCHSLARPLQSGITDDRYWADYVERMRLQPSSGISREDATPILRFLHYLSTGQLWRVQPAAALLPRDGGDE